MFQCSVCFSSCKKKVLKENKNFQICYQDIFSVVMCGLAENQRFLFYNVAYHHIY